MNEKYDKNGNLIYIKKFNNDEHWWEFDENNNLIYEEDSSGYEFWAKYGENNNRIEITKQEYEEIKFRKEEKEYNSRTKCSRFSLIDI